MRAIGFDREGITEANIHFIELLRGDVCWDHASVDDRHNILVADEGLLKPITALAMIGTEIRSRSPATCSASIATAPSMRRSASRVYARS